MTLSEPEEEEPVKLSVYGDVLGKTKIVDFSKEALKRYRSKALIKPTVASAEFNRILNLQGLLCIMPSRMILNKGLSLDLNRGVSKL